MPNQLSLPFEPEHYDERPEILVIGDYLLDKWYQCSSIAISAEAPVPVVKALHETLEGYPGGAGNVAANLEAMGWNVSPVYQDAFVGGIRNEPQKTRYKYRKDQVFRVDSDDEIKFPILAERLEHALAYAAKLGLPVVVADYNKGAVGEGVLQVLRTAIYTTDLPFYIHTKKSPDDFLGVAKDRSSNTIFFYNQKEAKEHKDLIFHKTVVTLGANGAYGWGLTDKTNAPIPGPVRSTCGAGDVFMAAYVTAKELYGHSNPLAIADAIAKKTVTECDYTCVYRGGF